MYKLSKTNYRIINRTTTIDIMLKYKRNDSILIQFILVNQLIKSDFASCLSEKCTALHLAAGAGDAEAA